MSAWSWKDVQRSEPTVRKPPRSNSVCITLPDDVMSHLDGIAAGAECSRAEMVRRVVVSSLRAPVASPLEEASAVDSAEVPSETLAARPVAAKRPLAASSQVSAQGRALLPILRKAPVEADGGAMFLVAVIAKRIAATENRVHQVFEHLEDQGDIEFLPCTLKGHVRLRVVARDGESLS